MTGRRSSERSAGRSAVRARKPDRRPVSERVIEELATVRGISPLDMERPLNDSVDPDALDAIFAPRYDGSPRTSEIDVEILYDGYRVLVRADGDIRLDPMEEPPV